MLSLAPRAQSYLKDQNGLSISFLNLIKVDPAAADLHILKAPLEGLTRRPVAGATRRLSK